MYLMTTTMVMLMIYMAGILLAEKTGRMLAQTVTRLQGCIML